jgi:hypothetical protein
MKETICVTGYRESFMKPFNSNHIWAHTSSLFHYQAVVGVVCLGFVVVVILFVLGPDKNHREFISLV